jgi:hypothetical protein
MNYSFDDASAPTNHPTQYFEMLGNRAIIDGRWKAVTYHGRKPWESRSAWGFDDDHWELYDIQNDPSECHDLMADVNAQDLSEPNVRKLIDLISLWWSEAGRYGVLPLDDRFMERGLERMALTEGGSSFTFLPGAERIPIHAAPNTVNRSWSLDTQIEVPAVGAEGPIVALGGDTNGWSLYLQQGKPTFCYNLAGFELTYIRAEQALLPGPHTVRYEFAKKGKEPFGAGGIGRIFVDGLEVAVGTIARTTAFGYSLDETFDVGCDKGAPVTNEYPPLASFSGKIIKVVLDLASDVTAKSERHVEAHLSSMMLRE